MVKTIVFDDEIALFWDVEWRLSYRKTYQIKLNGHLIAETDKTHYELKGLSEKTPYFIEIKSYCIDVNDAKTVWSKTITTNERKRRIDITEPPYNAVKDGRKNVTFAVQQALNDCGINDCVYFPKGIYLIGALNVKSDTEMFLDKGAVLLGTANIDDYKPKILSRFEGIELMCYRSLINIGTVNHNDKYNCKNVVIRGGGTISGGGQKLASNIIEYERENLKDFLSENAEYVKTCENEMTIPGRVRSKLVSVNNAENVIFSDITFKYGSAWNVHILYSKDVVTYNCRFYSRGVWNGDGWDPDSSENCTLFGCELDTADDGVAIKSGKNPEGNIINRPSKNIRVFDCKGQDGIAIGSELSGGIQDIFIWDCDMSAGKRGFRIKTTKKRGGFVRNVRIRDCNFAGIRIFTSYNCNDDGEGFNTTTKIKDIQIKNTICNNLVAKYPTETGWEELAGLVLEGFDDEEFFIENVKINGLKIKNKMDSTIMPIQLKNIKNVEMKDICFLK